MLTRRDLLSAAAVAALGPTGRLAAAATAGAAGQPFSWDWLQRQAVALAARPFTPPPPPAAGTDRITYDAMNEVRYKAAATQLRGASGGGVRFFPVNKFQPRPVEIFIVDGNVARPFHYRPDLFDMPPNSPLAALGDRAGFSGFRAMNPSGDSDWLAFAGASYFRSAGALDQYGLSARGLAIDSGGPNAEEFPDFTHFWLGRGPDGALLVDALLQGPSVVGAYRFSNRHGPAGVTQDVEVTLHLRRDVARLGLAPLTSMYWYDQSDRAKGGDWRPEVHDSDGLLIWNGRGERVWRPLNDPPRAITNSFADQSPKGYGLLQRDRKFDHYQDDGVFYEKRPNAWVEPRGDWGKGQVLLVELPTDTETNDNIVAFWQPAASARAGATYRYGYRLRWIAEEPVPTPLARVVETWRGVGGLPGLPPIRSATKLVADFAGPSLAGLSRGALAPDLVVTRGKADGVALYPVVGQPNTWRLMADLTPAGGPEPVDVRATLRRNGAAVSETLVTQLFLS
jgi:periplasmic glucans biosynthesis protein